MRKVLIVDGSKVSAAMVKKELLAHGYVCDMAQNMGEASDLLERETYFVALTGLSVDDAPDGAVVDLLLAKGIPTVVVTSTLDRKTIVEYQRKGIVDYVIKRSESIAYLYRLVRRLERNPGVKVLVVDDSLSVRTLLRTILGTQRLQVLEAGDGEAALEILEQNPDIRLVLTDYNMPRMDGRELILRIREEHPMDSMGIVVLSSDEKRDVPAQFLKSGANDFVNKKSTTEEILCRVNANLDTLDLLDESRERADKDYLTRLRNRRSFFDVAEKAIAAARRSGRPVGLVMLDLDHFKTINDTYGHDVGDVVLKAFASRLDTYVGREGFPARFGGEEFCVLLTGERPGGYKAFLEGLCRSTEKNVLRFGDLEIRYTVSMGLTTQQGLPLREMIARADKLLYEAKNGGRNRVVAD